MELNINTNSCQSYSPVQNPCSVKAHFWFYFHRLKLVNIVQFLLTLFSEQTTVGPKAGSSEYCFQLGRTN